MAVKGFGSGSGIIAIAAGASSSMALKSDGSVFAWGNNLSGQLGNGDTTRTGKSAPVAVTGLGPGSGVIAIAGAPGPDRGPWDCECVLSRSWNH
jgi:hypothetical protein